MVNGAFVVTCVGMVKFESVGVFQYHDEPMAASSKLDQKIDEDIARVRLKKLSVILDEVYAANALAAQGQEFLGYVMQMEDDTLIVRREIQAPEIDEYDEISYEDLIAGPEELDFGAVVEYRLGKK